MQDCRSLLLPHGSILCLPHHIHIKGAVMSGYVDAPTMNDGNPTWHQCRKDCHACHMPSTL